MEGRVSSMDIVLELQSHKIHIKMEIECKKILIITIKWCETVGDFFLILLI